MSHDPWPDFDRWRLTPPPGGSRFDALLQVGWECIGPVMHRGPFASLGDQTLGLVPIRQPLGAGLSRGQRKLLARNRRQFRISVRDRPDFEAAETLYQANQHRLLGDRFESLEVLAGRYVRAEGPSLFEVAIHDGRTLAAVSYFLIGEAAGYSLIGLFHPDYAPYSLGTQTLLEEIDFLAELGATLYYPGHVMVGSEALHYKLRLRGLEYLHWRDGWRPIAGFDPQVHPVSALWRRLAAGEQALATLGLSAQRVLYPLYSLAGIVRTGVNLLKSPEFLDVGPLPDGGRLAWVPRLRAGADTLIRVTPAPVEPWHTDLKQTLSRFGVPLTTEALSPPLDNPTALAERAQALLAGQATAE